MDTFWTGSMIPTLLGALVAFTPRPGDPGTVTLDLPILPGGEMAQALVVCSTGQLVGWWLTKRDCSMSQGPQQFVDQYSWQVREKVRKACDQHLAERLRPLYDCQHRTEDKMQNLLKADEQKREHWKRNSFNACEIDDDTPRVPEPSPLHSAQHRRAMREIQQPAK